jgi:hypothetical protein
MLFIVRAARACETETRISLKRKKNTRTRDQKSIPATPRVPHKNQKNMWVDSEIFQGQIFDEFPHYPVFSVIQLPIDPV